jgi:hypothetical protein
MKHSPPWSCTRNTVLWVPVIRFMSGGLRVLMDQPTEPISSHDPRRRRQGNRHARSQWRCLLQGAVRAVAVVMVGVLGQHRPQLPTAPVNPNHASRAFARLAASVGLAAHPHLLRHALASAMAAEREPASIIAAQLRHADGGALAQRVYIHQLPQTAPRLARLIEGVFGPAARATRSVSAPRRAEGNLRETRPSNPT